LSFKGKGRPVSLTQWSHILTGCDKPLNCSIFAQFNKKKAKKKQKLNPVQTLNSSENSNTHHMRYKIRNTSHTQANLNASVVGKHASNPSERAFIKHTY